jgi:hypothetical protein
MTQFLCMRIFYEASASPSTHGASLLKHNIIG